MTMDNREPRTEAGRSYLKDSLRGDPSKWADTPQKLLDAILAIEAEAAAPQPPPDDGCECHGGTEVASCSHCVQLAAAPPIRIAVCPHCGEDLSVAAAPQPVALDRLHELTTAASLMLDAVEFDPADGGLARTLRVAADPQEEKL